jgi:hypothetical protein
MEPAASFYGSDLAIDQHGIFVIYRAATRLMAEDIVRVLVGAGLDAVTSDGEAPNIPDISLTVKYVQRFAGPTPAPKNRSQRRV